MQSLAFLQV